MKPTSPLPPRPFSGSCTLLPLWVCYVYQARFSGNDGGRPTGPATQDFFAIPWRGLAARCLSECVCVLGKVKRGIRNTTRNRGRRLRSHKKKRLNAGVQGKHTRSKIFHDTLWVRSCGTRALKWNWEQTTKSAVVWAGLVSFFKEGLVLGSYFTRDLRDHI